MTRIYFDGVTSGYGCYIQCAMVMVNDDYTMSQLVNAIKEAGYSMFRLPTMHKLVKI